jgi:hypothetical protein
MKNLGVWCFLALGLVACGGGKKREAAPGPAGSDGPMSPAAGPAAAGGMEPASAMGTAPAGRLDPPPSPLPPVHDTPLAPAAPPSDQLEAFLKDLRAAGATEAGVNALLERIKLPEDAKEAPAAARAKIIELRTPGGLFGALILLCGDGKTICEDDCDVAFSLKQAPGKAGELVAARIPPELFSGKKHEVEKAPSFEATGALVVRYEIAPRQPCQPEEPSEYADELKRALLLKVGDRRIVPWQTYTEWVQNPEPGHNQTVDTTLSWHDGVAEGVHYLGVTRDETEAFSGTAPDIDNPRTETCTRSLTVIVMEKGKTWRSVTGKAVEALRNKEPGLVKLPEGPKANRGCP